MTAPVRRPHNEPYRRTSAHRKTDGSKEIIKDAFFKAWEQGTTFTITLGDEGNVKVQAGKKTVCYYQDAEAFAKDMFE